MASITSWTRLEPRTRRTDPSHGLQARLHDPAWLLARQWQVGEFTAEDAGSPLQVRVRFDRSPLTRFLAGPVPDAGGTGAPYNPAGVPLEVLVEREDPGMDLQLACEAGLHFLRLLDHEGMSKYRAAYVNQYAFTEPGPDGPLHEQTRRLLRACAGRALDGRRLASELRAAGEGALPAVPAIEAADRDRVLAAARAWLTWLNGWGSPDAVTPNTWNPERMEYSFAVAAPASQGERLLVANAYAQGTLDWQAFDQLPARSIGAKGDTGARQTLVRTAIPAPVTYRGMPVARWWEFEDGQVNFGAVDAEPTDLLRLLLLGFALDYGNDWFVIPAELPAGAIYEVTSLVVTDSFGERTLVRPYTATNQGRWRMFTLSGEPLAGVMPDENMFLVPPSLPAVLHGEPIEQVVFVRDEVANMAWAIERIVADAGGRACDRTEEYQDRSPAPQPQPPANGELRYRLSTTVPAYWLPLVPTRIDPAKPDIRLVRGRVLLEGGTDAVPPPARGRVLEPGRPLHIMEEEVPRSGVRVTRTWQYARWSDGSAHLWVGRRKGAGRGEGASGLRFDDILQSATGS